MRLIDRIHQAIEDWLPWYDRQQRARERAHTRQLVAASAASRGRAVREIHRSSDGIRQGYRLAGERLER